ncbi:hypothetical protein WJX72_002980 [[Myrmecia] bisecta]|uniref:Phospholipid scramblase n=1 Tax=[Myrmecia] bisecta TaxID=41462 RepID=A0AAW1P2J1_9CHLO
MDALQELLDVQEESSCLLRSILSYLGGLNLRKLKLHVSLCCCGRVNNCCGASCCKPNLILDVLSPDGRILEATAQKTYGRGKGCSALARCVFFFDNWVMEFPEHATAAERALLLTSLLNVEYAHFARTGGDL